MACMFVEQLKKSERHKDNVKSLADAFNVSNG